MSAILSTKWSWTLAIEKDGAKLSDVKVFAWDNITDVLVVDTVTSGTGGIEATVESAEYTIENVNDTTEVNKNPYTISCYKYGVTPKTLNIAFLASRFDTLFMIDNQWIEESDTGVVGAYTGIEIDHTNKVIKITEDTTVNKIYDYVQLDMISHPVKMYPGGIMETSNGSDYLLWYDLQIDGVSVSGAGKYIDMSTRELILLNGGSISARVRDKNGLQVTLEFRFSINPSITGYEWRMYDITAAGSLEGATEFAGEEVASADNQVYLYKHNGDRVIAVQILSTEYEENVSYYVLGVNNQNVIINLDIDNND